MEHGVRSVSGALFLHYDRAALDAEYDNRAKVTGAEDYIARWKARSKEARSEFDCNLDLAYGSSNAETLDFFPSNTPGKSPINIFYHGGYWRALHKDDFSYVASAVHEAGAATVVVNYALVPEVSFDELVRQCRAALAWVWRNADRFGGDREKIFVSGHSAGGHTDIYRDLNLEDGTNILFEQLKKWNPLYNIHRLFILAIIIYCIICYQHNLFTYALFLSVIFQHSVLFLTHPDSRYAYLAWLLTFILFIKIEFSNRILQKLFFKLIKK